MLGNHFSTVYGRIPGAGIHAFLASDILSPLERENLVGIAHSGGGGSMINAIQPSNPHLPIPIITLILVESPHVDHAAWTPFSQLYEIVKRSNSRRPTRWSSTEDAMEWFEMHVPWRGFHADVLRIIAETYFRMDGGCEYEGMVTTKTKVKQETACFLDDGTNLNALPFIRSILNILPTHLIIGDVKDIWPEEIYNMIEKNIEEDRPKLASVTTYSWSWALFSYQSKKPKELAREIFRILREFDRAMPLLSRL